MYAVASIAVLSGLLLSLFITGPAQDRLAGLQGAPQMATRAVPQIAQGLLMAHGLAVEQSRARTAPASGRFTPTFPAHLSGIGIRMGLGFCRDGGQVMSILTLADTGRPTAAAAAIMNAARKRWQGYDRFGYGDATGVVRGPAAQYAQDTPCAPGAGTVFVVTGS